MKTTLNIEDNFIERVAALTGVREKTCLVRRGLEALIAPGSSKGLAKLGGTRKGLRRIPRRRDKSRSLFVATSSGRLTSSAA